jgi:excisionase family DNA binding protein
MAERLAYRVHEASEAIGVSRSRTYELIAAGVIPSLRIGSSIRVPVEALRDWIAAHTQARTSDSEGNPARIPHARLTPQSGAKSARLTTGSSAK